MTENPSAAVVFSTYKGEPLLTVLADDQAVAIELKMSREAISDLHDEMGAYLEEGP